MANLKTIEEEKKKKKGGQGNKGRTSKKKSTPKKDMKIAQLKNLGNRVLVNKNYKFPKDVDKDPLALTLKKILLDKI